MTMLTLITNMQRRELTRGTLRWLHHCPRAQCSRNPISHCVACFGFHIPLLNARCTAPADVCIRVYCYVNIAFNLPTNNNEYFFMTYICCFISMCITSLSSSPPSSYPTMKCSHYPLAHQRAYKASPPSDQECLLPSDCPPLQLPLSNFPSTTFPTRLTKCLLPHNSFTNV